jgi:non-ribosomal peptide synthetase component F
VRLHSDAEFAAAYPQRQGAEVIVSLKDGRTLSHRLAALEALDAAGVRARTRATLTRLFDAVRAATIEAEVDGLVACPDAARLARLLGANGAAVTPPTMPTSRTIADLIDEMAQRYPLREALVGSGQRYTYRTLRAEVRRMARALHSKARPHTCLCHLALLFVLRLLLGRLLRILRSRMVGTHFPVRPRVSSSRAYRGSGS